jgi:uncharacterized membrane protein YhaH (DUF805 family)
MIEPTLNQYAPPTAAVSDVSPESVGYSELKYFSTKGRIGRLRYLAYSTGSSLIIMFVLGLVMGMLGAVGGGALGLIGTLVSLVAYPFIIWFAFICAIKRCHDANLSGWWSLGMFIPIANFAFFFMPGTKGSNKFGPPPPPNTLGVKVLGLILPIIFFVGIMAAIALPAYQAAKMGATQSSSQL